MRPLTALLVGLAASGVLAGGSGHQKPPCAWECKYGHCDYATQVPRFDQTCGYHKTCCQPKCDLSINSCVKSSDCPADRKVDGACFWHKTCCKPPAEPDETPAPTPPPHGGSGGDPWVEGLAGQRYNFDPHVTEDAWFAAVSEPSLQVNLKLHSYNWANPDDPAREFYTGVSVQYFDEDGFAEQSLLVEVRDADKFDAACSDLDPEAPEHCLGGGGIDVFVNGVRMLEGGFVETGTGYMLAASNVVTACHALFESQIRAHPIHGEQSRHLTAFDFESYLVDRAVRQPAACDRWIAAAKRNFGGIYAAPGVHSSIWFSGPRLTSVIEIDKHLPAETSSEPNSFRIGYVMPHYEAHGATSEGFIGESARVRYGADKQPLMSGHVLKGDYADYRVDGPFGREFKAMHIVG